MLKHLDLTNFRNYKKHSIDFANTTVLIGENGVGKTNILEAVSILSTGKSWRTKRDIEVVNWEEEVARIVSEIQSSNDKIQIEMVIQKNPTSEHPQSKIVKINDVKKKLTELLGVMPSVLFSPEEIQLLDGAPALRRRFLDILLCQIDKKYTLALLDLARIIRGRNKLLYFIKIGQAEKKELFFWDEKLVTLGSYIIKRRVKAIAEINKVLSDKYQEVAGQEETLQIKYKMTVEPEKFVETLMANQEREIESTSTLFGPHRDDLIFLLDSRDITTFGSRGELRSAILAAKVSELEYLASALNTRPLLLLDDIFSELDARRRTHLAKIIGEHQTIITTTDLGHIEKELSRKAKVIEIQ